MKTPALPRLFRATDGAAAMEFALVAPIFFMLLMGILDAGQIVYAKSVLNGAVQKAARNASLETANTAAADTLVADSVRPIVPGATFTSTRKSYYDFADIERAEHWNDANNNGTCDNNETYTDENRSGLWDADIGVSGNGGADDVIIYTVTASFKPFFSVPNVPVLSNTRTITASAVKKNQPFADQPAYGSTTRSCA